MAQIIRLLVFPKAELEYIVAGTGRTDNTKSQSGDLQPKQKTLQPPFWQILTSFPFFVVCITTMGNFWGFYTVMIGTPQYLNSIQHFSLEQVSRGGKKSLHCQTY